MSILLTEKYVFSILLYFNLNNTLWMSYLVTL